MTITLVSFWFAADIHSMLRKRQKFGDFQRAYTVLTRDLREIFMDFPPRGGLDGRFKRGILPNRHFKPSVPIVS